ncbi:hypothetical protein [Microvirga massiliensis]|uniref:hypothetical protein n=1 Tax=Microvirga massiliensis TaxID=1033741 RepID=UPI00062B5700|nr:hypothetical protein [Microvirga massiliensis]
MPHIATAVFKDRFAAERALQALLEAGIPADRAAIIGVDQNREISSISGFRELSTRDDLGAALDALPIPDDERSMLATHLAQGRALVAVRVDDAILDKTADVLELLDPVQMDETTEQAATDVQAGTRAPLGEGLAAGSLGGMTNASALPGMGTLTEGSSDLGTSDLQTGSRAAPYAADGSTTSTGERRGDARAGAPGALELLRRGRVRIYGGG